FYLKRPTCSVPSTLSLHDALPILPVLLLLGLVKLDPRVRTPRQLETLAGLPVLGVIPRFPTRATRARNLRRLSLAAMLFACVPRSEEHTSELQSRENLVCRLLLEK